MAENVKIVVPDSLIKDVSLKESNGNAKSVRLPLVLPDGNGRMTWGSIMVRDTAVTSEKYAKGRSSVDLHSASNKVNVNLPDGFDENGRKTYKYVEYTASEVKNMVREGFSAYNKEQSQAKLIVSDKLIRDVHSRETGRDFKSVRIPLVLPDSDGRVTWGAIAVSPKSVTPAEGDHPIPGKSQVSLRDVDSLVRVNLQDGVDENGNKLYKNVEYTADKVVNMAREGFIAYAKARMPGKEILSANDSVIIGVPDEKIRQSFSLKKADVTVPMAIPGSKAALATVTIDRESRDVYSIGNNYSRVLLHDKDSIIEAKGFTLNDDNSRSSYEGSFLADELASRINAGMNIEKGKVLIQADSDWCLTSPDNCHMAIYMPLHLPDEKGVISQNSDIIWGYAVVSDTNVTKIGRENARFVDLGLAKTDVTIHLPDGDKKFTAETVRNMIDDSGNGGGTPPPPAAAIATFEPLENKTVQPVKSEEPTYGYQQAVANAWRRMKIAPPAKPKEQESEPEPGYKPRRGDYVCDVTPGKNSKSDNDPDLR